MLAYMHLKKFDEVLAIIVKQERVSVQITIRNILYRVVGLGLILILPYLETQRAAVRVI